MSDRLRVWKQPTDQEFPWNWELRDKDGVYGSLATQQEALDAGLDEWRTTFPHDFDPDLPHVGHQARLTGAWWCETCDSPLCELA